MPNFIALAALITWPFLAFAFVDKNDLSRSICLLVIVPFLFLPSSVGFDFPGLPPVDKVAISCIVLTVILFIFGDGRFNIIPRDAVCFILFLLLIFGDVMTAISNGDPIYIADRYIKEMELYDIATSVFRKFFAFVPFAAGFYFLSNYTDHKNVLAILFSIGIFYAFLMLVEVRVSPQLHIWVYGFFPHNFAQQFRGGGFRPVVFLYHGLVAAFFAMTLTVVAAALWRNAGSAPTVKVEQNRRTNFALALIYFFIVLILCKSLGALIFSTLLVPVVLFSSKRFQITVSLALVLIAITYPVLRSAHLIPLDYILDMARMISTERAESLEFRFVNEERMLNHALERPIFGWGSWGRNEVYDAETGLDITVVDGYWIVAIGTSGWIGFIALFGLLGYPIFALWHRMRRFGADDISYPTCALALLLAINMIEMLPNATLPPWTWLIAGALMGYAKAEPLKVHWDAGIAQAGAPASRTIL